MTKRMKAKKFYYFKSLFGDYDTDAGGLSEEILRFFFLCGPFFEVFIEFVTTPLVFFNALAYWPQSMWDLSFPTRNRTHTPCTGRWNLNHWTTREVPIIVSFIIRSGWEEIRKQNERAEKILWIYTVNHLLLLLLSRFSRVRLCATP